MIIYLDPRRYCRLFFPLCEFPTEINVSFLLSCLTFFLLRLQWQIWPKLGFSKEFNEIQVIYLNSMSYSCVQLIDRYKYDKKRKKDLKITWKTEAKQRHYRHYFWLRLRELIRSVHHCLKPGSHTCPRQNCRKICHSERSCPTIVAVKTLTET